MEDRGYYIFQSFVITLGDGFNVVDIHVNLRNGLLLRWNRWVGRDTWLLGTRFFAQVVHYLVLKALLSKACGGTVRPAFKRPLAMSAIVIVAVVVNAQGNFSNPLVDRAGRRSEAIALLWSEI